MKTLLLVDGSSYLYRAFHAMPTLRAPDGVPTGAVYGVMNMLRRLERELHYEAAICVFDAKGKTFRHDLYPDYKAQRGPMADGLAQQIPLVHQAVEALGWPLLQMAGVEADDVIATLVTQAEALGWDTIVCTGDKDLAQLVSAKTRLYNSMSEQWFDQAAVVEKFGVAPEKMVDFLTLTGDTSDNIPGVHKCGEKTAAKWLAEFGSLEGVVAAIERGAIKGKIGDYAREALPHLPLSRELVTVKRDLDLSTLLPAGLAAVERQPPQLSVLQTLCRQLGFKAWLQEYSRVSAATPAENAPVATTPEPMVSPTSTAAVLPSACYHTLLTQDAFESWLARIEEAEYVSFDTETDRLDPLEAELVGISFAVAPYEAAYLPLAHRGPGVAQQLDRDWVLQRLKPWLENPAAKKVGQNLKFDRHVLARYQIRLQGVAEDTMLLSYVLQSHVAHNMDALAKRYLNYDTLTFEEICGKGAKQISFADVDLDTATRYAAEDADITLRLLHAMRPLLTPEAERVYRDIELPVAEILTDMEEVGVSVDPKILQDQSMVLGQRLLLLEQQVHAMAGQPFNLNSPKQVSEILFDRLQIPSKGLKKTTTGISTNEETLEKLATTYPIAQQLLDYRGLAKLKSTYTDKLPNAISPQTQRVHTHYSQTGTITGRLSSSEPNLQNIPIRSEEGRAIRKAFVAPAGTVIVSADYSQIELRIMAHLSQDEGLLQAFQQGLDIHRATAAEIFEIPLDEVSPEQRRYAKTINFGLIYGMTVFGLAKALEIERSAAQQFIDRYFQRYPGVARYMEDTRQLAREQGYVETVFGRRLLLPDINDRNPMKRQAAERAAINAPMQGTAADLIKMAMIRVAKRLGPPPLGLVDLSRHTVLMMQVHDELVLQVPEAEKDAVLAWLPQDMAAVATLRVPLLAEVGYGPSWGAAH